MKPEPCSSNKSFAGLNSQLSWQTTVYAKFFIYLFIFTSNLNSHAAFGAAHSKHPGQMVGLTHGEFCALSTRDEGPTNLFSFKKQTNKKPCRLLLWYSRHGNTQGSSFGCSFICKYKSCACVSLQVDARDEKARHPVCTQPAGFQWSMKHNTFWISSSMRDPVMIRMMMLTGM